MRCTYRSAACETYIVTWRGEPEADSLIWDHRSRRNFDSVQHREALLGGAHGPGITDKVSLHCRKGI